MSVVIGISASEHARYTQFTECLGNLEKPLGSVVITKTGIDIGINRRDIVREALEGGYEWVMFLDDDMLFPPDHLTRLLAHDLDVVASLYLTRKPPHFAVAYNEYVEGQGWRAVTLEGAPQAGLSEVAAAGTGGMLVRTSVFRMLPYDSWFLHEEGTEDLPFCARVIGAGYKIHLDLEARMGHLSTYAIWPEFTTSWVGAIQISSEKTIRVLLEKP